MSNTKKKETQIVGNTGMYYVCYQLSRMGWNVMPTARNARGVDVIAYNLDNGNYCGIQVKTLSRRNPVPLGKDLNKILGDFWVIVVLSNSGNPDIFVLNPDEVRNNRHDGVNKKGEVSHWLQPKGYDKPEFRDKWDKIQVRAKAI